MLARNTSKFKDTYKEVIIERITKAVKEIKDGGDRMAFIEQMISLSKLLMTYDLHISNAYKVIDEKAQDPTYFVAAYFDTNDIDKALWIHVCTLIIISIKLNY